MDQRHQEPGTQPDLSVQLSVLVPLHDEEDNVVPLHQVLTSALMPLELRYELLFVDDGSTDATAAALDSLAAQDKNLTVLRHESRRGKAAALDSAIAQATGGWILIMDGDLQYDPGDIPALLDALRGGGDVVSGRRDGRLDPWRRRTASRAYNALVNGLAGTRFRDHFSGLKGFRAEALARMDRADGMSRFPLVAAAYSGMEVREVPIKHKERGCGSSSYSMLSLSRLAITDLLALLPFLLRSKSSGHRPSS